MHNLMPIINWLPKYQRSWTGRDVVAGASVWAVLIPLGLAYAGVAGVDPLVGLYTLPLALLGYAIFGGTRRLVVGPDAAVAVLSGAIVATLVVTGDEHLALTLTFTLALIVGVIYALFFLFKLGWIADLIPDPVLKGFIEGVVWVTIVKQLPALLGLELTGEAKGFFRTLAEIAQALPEPHGATALVGVTSVVALLLLRRFAPRLPGPFFVLVGSIIIVKVFGLSKAGVAVLGETSGGLARLGLPTGLDTGQFIALLPGALAIVVLGYTKSVGALKRAVEGSGESFDPNHELLAIGVSNIGAGLAGGYAVAGSLTATAVNIDSRGKTQMGNLFAAILCALTIFFLLPLLADLAFSSLAAIVTVALSGLSNLGYFHRLWAVRRFEAMIGLATFVGVLALDVMPGVAIGVVLALFKLAHQIHASTTTVVGHTPSGAFVDIDDHPDAQEIPGMLILREYAPLSFLNARVLTNELRAQALGREDIRVVVLDATASSGIDTTALTAFIGARDDLAAEGIELWIVNVREIAWKMIVASLGAAEKELPPVFESLNDAVARYEQNSLPG